MQNARTKQVRLQLHADRVRPAEAKRDAMVARARAIAAPTIENGKATAIALTDIAESLGKAGPNASKMLIAQHLRPLVEAVVGKTGAAAPARVTLIDPALTNGAGGLGLKAGVAAEFLKAAAGTGLAGLLAAAPATSSSND